MFAGRRIARQITDGLDGLGYDWGLDVHHLFGMPRESPTAKFLRTLTNSGMGQPALGKHRKNVVEVKDGTDQWQFMFTCTLVNGATLNVVEVFDFAERLPTRTDWQFDNKRVHDVHFMEHALGKPFLPELETAQQEIAEYEKRRRELPEFYISLDKITEFAGLNSNLPRILALTDASVIKTQPLQTGKHPVHFYTHIGFSEVCI